ncbi:MAG: hypothetical protein LUB58_01900 [Oscillospiraceae bacterium]|nr:hypothetical protein [Oscillospiraceae bacterium]
MTVDEELKQLLEKLPDVYDDFVICTLIFCETEENKRETIDFIKDKGCENLTTLDVIDFTDRFGGFD